MAPSESPRDAWESADAYERFMGRWSRELARSFVLWLDVPAGRHWLEVGCGTGALTSRILEIGFPASVVSTDPSPQFIAYARATHPDDRVEFLVAGVDDLPSRSAGYDVVLSSLVLNFLPDPTKALREMGSRAAEDGMVAACVWDYAGGMEFLRRFWDAAVELDPAARRHDEGARFPICSPAALIAAFRAAGFPRVKVEALEIPTPFRDFARLLDALRGWTRSGTGLPGIPSRPRAAEPPEAIVGHTASRSGRLHRPESTSLGDPG